MLHCKNSIGILTTEYGYLSFMFDLSTPGTETDVKSVQNVYKGMWGIEDRVNDSPLVPCVQPRGEHPLWTVYQLWTVYPLHVKLLS